MNTADIDARQQTLDWQRANHTILAAGVAEVRADIEHFLARQSNAAAEPQALASVGLVDASGEPLVSTLDSLCRHFELTPLERKIILLCLGVETDSRFAALCARVHGDDEMAYPTLCLALRVFEADDWTVCSPHGSLRKWEIIELGQGRARIFQPIALSERILDYLLDNSGIDRRLQGMVQPVTGMLGNGDASAEEYAVAREVAGQLAGASSAAPMSPAIQLCGNDLLQNRRLAQMTAAALGCGLHALALECLPHDPTLLERALHLWEREAILGQSLLLVEHAEAERSAPPSGPPLSWVLDRLRGPLLVSSRSPQRGKLRRVVTVNVPDRQRQHAATSWAAFGVVSENRPDDHRA
ncbi:hypothetical protein [Haliangium ochraceum]|uniref:Winged helix domain-containing protein n=1 Tax=Haliangium ochraceum (strain DSM 14365 / JCM 11303 / SMP-2) TaxID=502025 RepID=D0LQN5_HALO1|nr:hypothetical protein [Haliangium ochraceum]ACY13595.1 hypothetical protein Hoch_0994 [Haliangium ochraceum DSM 14365]